MMRMGSIASGSAWFATGHVLRVLLVGANFVFATHFLGPEGYGAFAALIALATALNLVVGLGSESLLLRDLARDKDCFDFAWSRLLVWILLTVLVLLPVMWGLSALLPGGALNFAIIVSAALSELLFLRLVNGCSLAFQASERLLATSLLYTSLAASRLVFTVGAAYLLGATLVTWSLAYLLGTAIVAAFAVTFTQFQFNFRFRSKWLKRDVLTGAFFAAGQVGQRVYNDVDKPLLAARAGFDAAGIYSAANRIVDLALVPLVSLQAAASARLLVSGQKGPAVLLRQVTRLVIPASGLAIIASIVLFASAPWLVRILGQGFEESAEALRWLAILPVLRTLSLFALQSLAAIDLYGFLVKLEWVAVVVSVGLNVALIPSMSWRGSVIAILLSQCIIGLAGWVTVIKSARRAR